MAVKVLYAWSEFGLVGSWHGDDDRAGGEDEICSSRSPPLWPRCKGIKQELAMRRGFVSHSHSHMTKKRKLLALTLEGGPSEGVSE